MKVKIMADVYNISKRIRLIDKDYFILYDTSKHCFEIHNKAQKNTYCVTLPYNTLDERTINYTLKTRSQNVDKIMSEIEAENLRRDRLHFSRVLDEVDDSLNQLKKENL